MKYEILTAVVGGCGLATWSPYWPSLSHTALSFIVHTLRGKQDVLHDLQGASGVATMSIAIIVDDRMDVWEAAVRDQLVMAAPFNHYPTCAAAAIGEGPGPSHRGHEEMARILNYLRGLRRDLFHFWDNCMGPAVRAVLDRGVPNAFFALDMHAIMAASPYVNVNSMRPSARLPMPADAAGNMCVHSTLPPTIQSPLDIPASSISMPRGWIMKWTGSANGLCMALRRFDFTA